MWVLKAWILNCFICSGLQQWLFPYSSLYTIWKHRNAALKIRMSCVFIHVCQLYSTTVNFTETSSPAEGNRNDQQAGMTARKDASIDFLGHTYTGDATTQTPGMNFQMALMLLLHFGKRRLCVQTAAVQTRVCSWLCIQVLLWMAPDPPWEWESPSTRLTSHREGTAYYNHSLPAAPGAGKCTAACGLPGRRLLCTSDF